ncbi:toll/interleukin-1 receptor domain-containing protein [Thiothrix nivea]|uniref:TIR protein n=1 Tax=Thiothrix nivea (strain ATCC 35100 / DSM 5205 / JP2) TaxID=870187 RepID=A0A656HBS2_THINJ|nr:toll/interleukin-1 receptor domain-containing protein [Thiothrix nivea]EIJ34298.1 TIR protein [Thiothrix nivea DSM 5205]
MIAVIPKSHAANRMTDIFISYSRNDQQWVAKLAKALEDVGYSVWWDTQLLAGDDFHRTIPAVLEEARCAIVVWSKVSIDRQWVRAEAYRANEREVLVPVRIEEVQIPLPFNLLHAEDMKRWNGKADDPAFRRLLGAIARHCPLTQSIVADEPLPKPESKPDSHPPKRSMTGWLAMAGIATVVAIAIFLFLDRISGKQTVTPPAVVEEAAKPAPPPEPTTEEKLKQAREWLESEDATKEKQAVEQLQPLADAGNAEAKRLLGISHFRGLAGMKADTANGCTLYKEAADAGNEKAKDIHAKLCSK